MRRLLLLLSLVLALPARAACPEMAEVARLAQAMLERRPVPPGPALGLADAVCARERLVAVLSQAFGDVVGHVVDLRFGAGQALRGAVYFGTLREVSGAELPVQFGAVPLVQPALLLRMRRDLDPRLRLTHMTLLRHADAVIPFLALSDGVFEGGAAPEPARLLQINLGTRAGVVGDPVPVTGIGDYSERLGQLAVTLTRDGETVETGAPRRHPLDVLAWLVADLAREERYLRAEEHVAITGFLPAVPAAPGLWRLTYSGLTAQPVSVSVALR